MYNKPLPFDDLEFLTLEQAQTRSNIRFGDETCSYTDANNGENDDLKRVRPETYAATEEQSLTDLAAAWYDGDNSVTVRAKQRTNPKRKSPRRFTLEQLECMFALHEDGITPAAITETLRIRSGEPSITVSAVTRRLTRGYPPVLVAKAITPEQVAASVAKFRARMEAKWEAEQQSKRDANN